MQKVVIIQGSSSDNPYVDSIAQELKNENILYERRIASAHRTPSHLQRILDIYQNSKDDIVAITVAGLSDALSGTVAARLSIPTVACPPDAANYGEIKKFSSAKTPSGITVNYTTTPREAVNKVKEIFSKFDFSGRQSSIEQYNEKRIRVMTEDARLQGADNPLPLTLWKVGKVREVYDLGSKLLINSSDRISAFDEVSVTRIEGKGEALNLLSAWWFKQTKNIIPNHLIKIPDTTMILARKAKRIDIEWVTRNYLYGSMFRDYKKGEREFWGYKLPDGMQLAEKLPEMMLTPTTKEEHGHDVKINREDAISRKLVTPEEWKQLQEATFRLYEYYDTVARQKGLIIPDIKLEFGVYKRNLIQIDEAPDHDSARFWIEKKHKIGEKQETWCLDKEFYRQFLLDSGVNSDKPPHPLPEIPKPVVDQIQLRVVGVYEVFSSGKPLYSFRLKSLEDVKQELKGGKL